MHSTIELLVVHHRRFGYWNFVIEHLDLMERCEPKRELDPDMSDGLPYALPFGLPDPRALKNRIRNRTTTLPMIALVWGRQSDWIWHFSVGIFLDLEPSADG
ncbi:MAG: hypothetical protein DMG14_08960 [Acidobacteria bacterium]|nr:MAG: hypothetical protein DMG14_08960 [Acidobacteriota bacterium]